MVAQNRVRPNEEMGILLRIMQSWYTKICYGFLDFCTGRINPFSEKYFDTFSNSSLLNCLK